MIAELKKLIPNLSKITYFTDGAGSQYKNKYNFINLCHHEQDFGVKAVWNYSATRQVYLLVIKRLIFNNFFDDKDKIDIKEYHIKILHFLIYIYLSVMVKGAVMA